MIFRTNPRKNDRNGRPAPRSTTSNDSGVVDPDPVGSVSFAGSVLLAGETDPKFLGSM